MTFSQAMFTPENNQAECLGVVLAGGQSSRMGQDKAQLMRNKTKMIDYSKQLLTDSGVSTVIISGDQHQVPDLVSQAGPVGGIYSVIIQYQPKALLILPVDLPLMKADELKKLRLAGELSQKACYFEGNNIPLYLPVNAYLELFLAKAFNHFANRSFIGNRSAEFSVRNKEAVHSSKGPSVKALLEQVPHKSLTITNPMFLCNTNTPEQWQQASKSFA